MIGVAITAAAAGVELRLDLGVWLILKDPTGGDPSGAALLIELTAKVLADNLHSRLRGDAT